MVGAYRALFGTMLKPLLISFLLLVFGIVGIHLSLLQAGKPSDLARALTILLAGFGAGALALPYLFLIVLTKFDRASVLDESGQYLSAHEIAKRAASIFSRK